MTKVEGSLSVELKKSSCFMYFSTKEQVLLPKTHLTISLENV